MNYKTQEGPQHHNKLFAIAALIIAFVLVLTAKTYAATDTTAPVIGNITVLTETVESPGDLEFIVPITEEDTGLQCIILRIVNDTTNIRNKSYYYDEGNYTGDYTITYSIPEDCPTGEWMIQVMACDNANNWTSYKAFPAAFTVVKSEKVDNEAPVIHYAYVDSNTFQAPCTFYLYVDITEEMSGLSQLQMEWKTDRDSIGTFSEIYEFKPDENKSGLYVLPLDIPQDYPECILSLSSICATDGAGNVTVYEGSNINVYIYAYTPPTPELIGISIVVPEKLVYETGEAQDYTGLVVYEEFEDGSRLETIDYYVTGFTTAEPGEYMLTVFCPSETSLFTASFQIKVNTPVIIAPPDEPIISTPSDAIEDTKPDNNNGDEINSNDPQTSDSANPKPSDDPSNAIEAPGNTDTPGKDNNVDDVTHSSTTPEDSKDVIDDIHPVIPEDNKNPVIENETNTSNTHESAPSTNVNNYSHTSSGGGSSSGGYRNRTVKATILSPYDNLITLSSVYEGTWEYDQSVAKWKYKDKSGSYISSRWVFYNSKWYLIGKDGYMITGWQLADSHWYFMSQSGAMLTGWNYINDEWYYLDSVDGYIWSSCFTPDNFWVDESGKYVE